MNRMDNCKRINRHVFTRNREWHQQDNASHSDSDEENGKALTEESTVEVVEAKFQPSFADLLILVANANKSKTMRLPTNLIIEILELIEYFPKTSAIRNQIVPGGRDQNDLHLSSSIKPIKYFSVLSIEYVVESKDQGWSSSPANQQGTRFGSYTWAEAAVSSDFERYEVCVNIHAGTVYERQNKVFTEESPFYEALMKEMNRQLVTSEEEQALSLQLWIRSLYPGWANHVRYAEIIVTWKFTGWEEYINTHC